MIQGAGNIPPAGAMRKREKGAHRRQISKKEKVENKGGVCLLCIV